jgi:hypothetical protein
MTLIPTSSTERPIAKLYPVIELTLEGAREGIALFLDVVVEML